MAADPKTLTTEKVVTIHEDLSDVISQITPEDTPFLSLIGKGTTGSTRIDWATDELSALKNMPRPEGDEYTLDEIIPPVRLSNFTQIMRRTGVISRTQESVRDAGGKVKRGSQLSRKGIELRRDFELAIVTPSACQGGTTRILGGLGSWLVTNVSREATGSSGGYNVTTTLTKAPTDGKQRAMTKDMVDGIMQSGFSNGASNALGATAADAVDIKGLVDVTLAKVVDPRGMIRKTLSSMLVHHRIKI